MSDFTNVIDSGVVFSNISESDTVDFTPTGDDGLIIVTTTSRYGEGVFGEGPYGGGTTTVIIGVPTTVWTNIDTP